MSVPTYRVRGQPAQLECDFELGADRLYSVKWYRDNEEFYRYMPKYEPPKHAYKLEGIKVDVSNSCIQLLIYKVKFKKLLKINCLMSIVGKSGTIIVSIAALNCIIQFSVS